MTKGMTTWMLLLTVILFSFSHARTDAADQPAAPADVATVNGTAISDMDFQISLDRLKQRFRQQGGEVNDASLKKLETDALEGLISQELLFQDSRKAGFHADKKDVDQQLEQFKQQFTSPEAFQQALQERGLAVETLTSQIEKGMTIQQFVQERFVSQIDVPPADTREFYDANLNLFMQPEMVKASHVLIKVEKDADDTRKAAADAKIQEILLELDKGADFGETARRFSEGPSASNGGDLGFFRRGQMVPPFEQAAFALDAGAISRKVETRFGYHIIKVTEKKAAAPVEYDEAKERISQHLRQVKADQAIKGHIEKLRASADIQRLR